MNNILHIDCDAFYAACEEIKNPSLKNKAIAVGGLSNRSIITTANYEARKYGIHSAMPVFMAKKACKNLIILPVDRAYYLKKSREVFSIVKDFSKKCEQVSIDEAYLDTGDIVCDKDFARKIQNEIYKKTSISVSIGISYNKFLSKLASDWNKPHGIKIIEKNDVPEILLDLDISKVHGLGRKSEGKLKSIGVYKISDLLKLDRDFLEDLFGKNGSYIYEVIRGNDDREVSEKRERKSIARERTFEENTKDKEKLSKKLESLSEGLEDDLKKKNISARTLTIKMKTEDFINHSKSISLQEPIFEKEEIYKVSKELLDSFYLKLPLRLLGISLSKLSPKEIDQLSIFD